MRIKISILVMIVLFAIVFIPGGYSLWDEKLSIQGTIIIDAPADETSGSAILLEDTSSDEAGGSVSEAGNSNENEANELPDDTEEADVITQDGSESIESNTKINTESEEEKDTKSEEENNTKSEEENNTNPVKEFTAE